MSDKNEFVKEWLYKATEDFELAVFLLNSDSEFFSPICFHLQQAAEKFLKALLTFNEKEVVKTHSIEFLLKECEEFSNEFNDINTEHLSDFAVGLRYPAYVITPSKKEALCYRDIVEFIKNVVIKNIKID